MHAALSACPAGLIETSGWHARLNLDYERRGARTVLVRNLHAGPLVVQKSLYPEGDAPCQNVIVHPPGGIAGGDSLHIAVTAGAETSIQLLTPGATKWYRSSGARASQQVDLRIGIDAAVEWLPHEAVVFDGARAKICTRVDLDRGARYLGWDVACLGRTASGEQFRRGLFQQQVEIRGSDRLLWAERAIFEGDSSLLHSSVGLRGQPVFGTFVAAGTRIDDDALARCRTVPAQLGQGAVTRIDGVTLGRYRGSCTAAARQYFIALWQILRPLVIGCPPRLPRIWST